MYFPWSVLSRPARVKSRPRKPAKTRPCFRRRPEIERLEDRNLLSVFHVDVSAAAVPGGGTPDDINDPFHTIQEALRFANDDTLFPGADEVIVYGNNTGSPLDVYVWTRDGDEDNDLLEDRNMFVGQDTTLRFVSQTRAGVLAPLVVKLGNNIIDVDTLGTLRVEGATGFPITFTSLQDDTAGGDTNQDGSISGPNREDWGGIRFRGSATDMGPDASTGSLINYADIRFTGARLFDEVAQDLADFASIRLEFDGTNAAQVRVLNTVIRHGGTAFDVDFRALGTVATDANSVVTGPEIRNITFEDNTLNGLFVNIPFLTVIPPQDFDATWDDVGTPYVLSQRLTLVTPLLATQLTTLTINAGMVVKSENNAINATGGQLFVDGTRDQPVIFSSLTDDVGNPAYNNGHADTNNDLNGTLAAPGDWGGIIVSEGHIDHARFRFGGGEVPVDVGVFDNQSPIQILSFDLRPLGPLQTFRVSNTEIDQTFTGTVEGGNFHNSPAMEIAGDGEISVIDNFIHDNQGLAIRTASSVYHARSHTLGGYGIHMARNVFSGNQINGVFTDAINNFGYLDDSDIVQTIGTGIFVTGTNQVFQLMSQRGALPFNIDGSPGFLVRFDTTRYANSDDAFTAFLTDPDLGLLAQQIVGVDEGPLPGNGDNGLFYYLINFEDIDLEETGGVITLSGVGQGDPGNIRGEEWRDLGVDFTTTVGTDQMPLSVRAGQEQNSFFTNTTPVDIDDDFLTPATSSINVLNSFTISDVNVHLDITHPRVGDLLIELVHGGTTIRLVDQAGGTGQNFTSTGLDDEALTAIEGGSAPFTGSFRPDESLSAFDNQDAAGLWTLRITDLATGQGGLATLNSWALRIAGAGGSGDADPFAAVSGFNMLSTADASNGSLDLFFPNSASAVGFWIVDNEETSTNERIEFIGEIGNVLETIALPTTGSGPVFIGRISKQAITRVRIFEDADDQVGGVFTNNTQQALIDGGTALSTINVGASFTISDLNVLVNITHPRPNDLLLELVAPGGGTRIQLVNQVFDSGPNFTNTLFDDEAAFTIANGSAPYTGSFQPEEPLSTFDGLDANGTWTLEITDLVSGNVGTLNSWQLRFTSPNLQPDHMGIDDLYFVEAGQGLTVKFQAGAGITAGGFDSKDVDLSTGSIVVGATLRILGQPDDPVSLTSFADDTAGAGVVQHLLWQTAGAKFDTNNNGASTGTPGDWNSILINPGANSSNIEVVTQQPNGTIVRRSNDLNPYTIGDEPGSTIDVIEINPLPAAYNGFPLNQNTQDGTLIEHADIRFSTRGIDYRGYPDDELSIEGNETENNDTTGTADPLLPLVFNGFGDVDFPQSGQLVSDMVFQSHSGADRIGATAGGGDTDFYLLPQPIAGGRVEFVPTIGFVPYTNWVVDVDHLAPGAGVNISVFNENDQLIYFNSTTPTPTVTSFDSVGTPVPIPDGPNGVVSNTINVGPGFNVQDVNVRLNITHSRDRDLRVELTHLGVTVVLFDGVGGDGDNFTNTLLDDEASVFINAGVAPALPPFTGSFRPTPGSLLSAFDGLSSAGAWTLTVTDNFTGETGTLQDWRLILTDLTGGTAGFMGPIDSFAGDIPFNIPNTQPVFIRDSHYIVITPVGREPFVLNDPDGPFPFFLPIGFPGSVGEGFEVFFVNADGNLTNSPSDSSFVFNGVGPGGYEMEVRRPLGPPLGPTVPVPFPPLVEPPVDREQDVIRPQNGEVIFRDNFIRDTLTFGINLQDSMVAGALGQLVPSQAARYFFPNGDGFSNPNALIPGAQVYNNIITGSQADGIRIIEDSLGLPGTTSVPTGHHLILNNTLHANTGVGINLTTKGGSVVMNNIFTNNDVGLRVTDLVPTGFGQTQVAYNLFFNNTTANFQGTFNGSNNKLNINPSYVDVANGDFRLLFGSQAIDAGLSNLADRLISARSPAEPTRAPNDDNRNVARVDNGATPNVGAGQFPFFDIGGMEANEPSLRVVALSLFTGNSIIGGPISTFTVTFFGRVLLSSIIPNSTVKLTAGGVTGPPIPLNAGFTNAYDPATNLHTFTFTLVNPIISGTFSLLLDGVSPPRTNDPAIRDIAGQLLDGEFSKSFPSGNGVAGGSFVYTFVAQVGTIGDTVFNDVNSNGTQDPGELGLFGVSVNLLGAGVDGQFGTPDDIAFPAEVTDSNGNYLFTPLADGLYRVSVDLGTVPTGFVLTTGNSPLDINLAIGENNRSADFGFQERTASIGDLVWNDLDGDTIKDANEVGIPGVNLADVWAGGDNTFGTLDDISFGVQVTDANGNYTFTSLPAGLHRVDVIETSLPPNFALTTGNEPLDVTLANNQAFTGADFGYFEDLVNASIGNLVWDDINGNGVFDAGFGETGLGGVEVTLHGSGPDRVLGNGDDVIFTPQITAGNGNYAFSNLPAWRYIVDVTQSTVPLPTPFRLTTGNLPLNLDLLPGQSVTTADFGFQETNASIAGRIFDDADASGAQNGGETGFNNATVFADEDNDGILDPGERSDTTDVNGDYIITQLGGGVKNIRVVLSTLPANFFPTTPHPTVVILPNGSANVTGINLGFQFRDAVVGDRVFDDQNGNGIFDAATEAGVPGITVFDDRDNNGALNGTEAFTTTNASGIYSLNITSGVQHRIRVVVPPGAATSTANPVIVTVGAGQTNNNVDFGLRLPNTFYLVLTPGGTLTSTGGATLAVTPQDIVKLTTNGLVRTYTMYLDGSDVGLGSTETIDAFTFLPNGDIVVSIITSWTVNTTFLTPGAGTGPILTGFGEDLIRFTPTSVGQNTAGSWVMHFDGSDVGLSGTAENVDAVSVLSDGRILMSTAGAVGVTGVTGADTDLLAFTPTTLGDTTAGSFSFFFDGSDVGLSDATAEDIDGLFVQETGNPALPTLFFSARGAFSVAGSTGVDEDIFRFTPTTLGLTTTGTFGPGLRFDGSTAGLGPFNVIGFRIGTAPGAFPLQAEGFAPVPEGKASVLPVRWTDTTGVNVLIGDSLGGDQAARVRDALAEINAHWQTTGMQFVEVSDPVLADVSIQGAAESPGGGLAEGVLGWSAFQYDVGIDGFLGDGTPFQAFVGHDLGQAAVVTLVSGWNWYGGADAGAIGADQYDFQSVVAHELGHMIGLEHSEDAASIMAESLATGQVRRQLSDTDRDAIDRLYGAVYESFQPEVVPALETGLLPLGDALGVQVPLSVLATEEIFRVRPEPAVLDPLTSMLALETPRQSGVQSGAQTVAQAVDELFALVTEPRDSSRPVLPEDDALSLWTDPWAVLA